MALPSILMAASSSSSALTVPLPPTTIKLDRKNFDLWRSTMMSSLEAYELESFISAAKPPPETHLVPDSDGGEAQSEPNPTYISWKRRDRLVLLWIRSTLSDRTLALVARASSSRDAWVTIEKSFQAQTRARRMQLKLQLQTLTKGALSMLEYIEKKRRIADSLAQDLQPISDEDLVGHILSGLDSSYGGFVTAFMMAADRLSIDDLVGLLLQEEARQERDRTSSGVLLPAPAAPPLTAFAADRSTPHSDGPRFSHRYSAGASHASPRSSSGRPRPTCQLCRTIGHVAINCCERGNLTDYPSRCPPELLRSSSSRPQQRSSRRQAYIAQHGDSSTVVDPAWYFDSRATDHVTPDIGNLNLAADYHGTDKLQVGNGFTRETSSPRRSR
ncbi:Retrovirus-related Pol polyprotein from transposon RE1 [Linum grandiflorum]